MLEHSSWSVRFAAVDSLLDLEVQDPELQQALNALGAHPEAARADYGIPRTEQLNRLRSTLAELQGRLDPAEEAASQIAQACEELKDASDEVRFRAVNRLRGITEAEAFALLLEALEDPAARIRASAALALGDELITHALPELLRHLSEDPSEYVRAICASVLMWLRDPRTFEPLVQALTADDWRLRSMATTALGGLGDPRAIPPLLE